MYDLNVSTDLRLREIEMSYAQQIFSIIDKDREYLREWLPFVDYTRMVEDTEAFIKGIHAEPSDKKETTFVIIQENKVVGIIGFRGTDRANHKTEIGYWLAHDKQGQGLITNSCKTLLALSFTTLNMNRVMIKCAINNSKSNAIPKRLGFKFEGIERSGEFLNGKYVDLDVYSLLKQEWKQMNNAN